MGVNLNKLHRFPDITNRLSSIILQLLLLLFVKYVIMISGINSLIGNYHIIYETRKYFSESTSNEIICWHVICGEMMLYI